MTPTRYTFKISWCFVSFRAFISMMKNHEQSYLERKVFICLTFPCQLKEVRTGTKQGRDPEAEADAVAMEGCCLLAHSSWFVHPAFLKNPGSPAQGRNHAQWAETAPLKSLIKSSQRTPVCVKLTEK